MKLLAWAIRLVIFSLVLAFALQNTEAVHVRFLADQIWQAPLVVVVLVFFAAGFVFGILAVVGLIYRQRREISRLRKMAPPATSVAQSPGEL